MNQKNAKVCRYLARGNTGLYKKLKKTTKGVDRSAQRAAKKEYLNTLGPDGLRASNIVQRP
ncbi:MAG TPA: hypothetical protein VF077_05845 [Nitrospiraceae bacterium]